MLAATLTCRPASGFPVSDDPVAARTALAEKLAYYGPSISAPMLASVGLQPQDFAEAAGLAHTGHAAAQLIDDRMLSLGAAPGTPPDGAAVQVRGARPTLVRGICRLDLRSGPTR